MKRGAEEQLTKDNANREDEAVSAVAGTFEKAPPEVLAKRRILKVRRSLPTPPATGEAKPTNPFANIGAKPEAPPAEEEKPANPLANLATKPEAPSEGNGISQGPSKTAEPETKEQPGPSPSAKEAPSVEEEKKPAEEKSDKTERQEEPQNDSGVQAKEGVETKVSEDVPKSDEANETTERTAQSEGEKSGGAKSADAKQNSEAIPNQTSAEDKPKDEATNDVAQNAGKQDLGITSGGKEPNKEVVAATAKQENASSEAAAVKDNTASDAEKQAAPLQKVKPVGAEEKPKDGGSDKEPAAKANGADTNPKPVFTFGNSDGAPALTFANAAAADKGSFNIKVAPAPPPTKPSPAKEFKEAPVQTGEEGEEELFRARAKLYNLEMKDGAGRWRERGVGNLKLNKHKETGKVRMVMRTEATLRVVLNSPVFPEFKLDRATERSLRFQGYDVEDTEGKNMKSFLVRFPTKDVATGLEEAIEKWKKSSEKKSNN